MTYLLDTCIISKLRRIERYPDSSLENWIKKQAEKDFFLSVLTIGEIEHGINKLKNPAERRIIEEWYRGRVIPRFEGRILNINLKVAAKWGALLGMHQVKGTSLPVVDSLIAATALVHDLIVVTENIKDFSAITELKLFNPWEQ